MILFKIRLLKIVFLLTHFKYLAIFLKFKACPSLENLNLISSLKFNNILDVGANIGQFSLLASFLYPNKKIIAFEPISICYEKFLRVFENNKNIHIYKLALGNVNKRQKFFITESNDSSSFFRPINYNYIEEFDVQIKRADSIIDKKLLKNSLLKIDVQGFEFEVLKGFSNSLKDLKYILVEISSITLYENQPLFDSINRYLMKKNFKCIKVDNKTKFKNNLYQADYLYLNNSLNDAS